ncbi:E3 ubiquitin-protein ligase TRIM36-like [Mugil cephalus]|uniref:E3 ubiquitin-protein ligase TRIM36-like n=1 Tax=Mugil cephalus TaxID=48193 RepID=UPI001FB5D4AC|nr:E3 ubiquitin-protein ligase TRIM36-like [Mugil cephalus]
MATASSFLSEDQFLCSICLEVYTEPVSIPCGHNFCKACLTRHWADKDQCQCPLCKEKFGKGLKLCVNTVFREVVENFNKHHVAADSDSVVKPGQVPCDCCIDNKLRASKTCLICLASYCETHLEPHHRVAALKRHKLTNPVHNLEDKICKKHNRILEFFCRNDNSCVCVMCTEHSDHDTVPLNEEYVDKRAKMGKKNAEVQHGKQKRGKKGQKMKGSVQNKRKGKDEARANSVVSNQMIYPPVWWFPSEVPHHFCEYCHIPVDRGFSGGRYFYVVQARGRAGWDLGIIRESMNPRDGNWIVRLRSNGKPDRVLVFVDYDSGQVFFYDADNKILMYSITDCNFSGRVFLFFGPPQDASWTQRLQKWCQKIWRPVENPDAPFLLAALAGLSIYYLLSLF